MRQGTLNVLVLEKPGEEASTRGTQQWKDADLVLQQQLGSNYKILKYPSPEKTIQYLEYPDGWRMEDRPQEMDPENTLADYPAEEGLHPEDVRLRWGKVEGETEAGYLVSGYPDDPVSRGPAGERFHGRIQHHQERALVFEDGAITGLVGQMGSLSRQVRDVRRLVEMAGWEEYHLAVIYRVGTGDIVYAVDARSRAWKPVRAVQITMECGRHHVSAIKSKVRADVVLDKDGSLVVNRFGPVFPANPVPQVVALFMRGTVRLKGTGKDRLPEWLSYKYTWKSMEGWDRSMPIQDWLVSCGDDGDRFLVLWSDGRREEVHLVAAAPPLKAEVEDLGP